MSNPKYKVGDRFKPNPRGVYDVTLTVQVVIPNYSHGRYGYKMSIEDSKGFPCGICHRSQAQLTRSYDLLPSEEA